MDEKELTNDKVIYVHKNQKTGQVFYVGIGYEKRPFFFRKRNKHWNEYVKINGKPQVDILLTGLSLEVAKKLEVYLITHIGLSNLTNLTMGGQGSLGRKCTALTKEKISQSRIKNNQSYQTEEYRKKMSIIKSGFKHTETSKQKIGLSKKGKKRDAELMKRISSFRKPVSEENKAKTSDRFKNITRNTEWRRKIGEANRRRKIQRINKLLS